MERTQTLIVGAGISGLAAAAALQDRDYVVLEADSSIGGYCKTVKQDGFTWDYSGHFFHFKHPEIESWLRDRMPNQRIIVTEKKSFIAYADRWIDFPFQKNIHQLPKSDFIDCLYDLYFASVDRTSGGATPPEQSFLDMLRSRFGQSICDKFLVPYNEKLYACDLSTLDKDAMGRFFPHADLTDIIRNMRQSDNRTYNATFTYPEGGAIEYVNALARAVRADAVSLGERLLEINLKARIARTSKREIAYDRLISSAPFPSLLRIANVDHDASIFTWNKVLVFNLGFDKKGKTDVHWVYYPDRECSFYRIGFYDNIFDTDRMSLYVEVGLSKDAPVPVDSIREKVLRDLKAQGIVSDHKLVSQHSVLMDPAYVHINGASRTAYTTISDELEENGVYSIGRYGGWTYCSIEDCIVEARELVKRLNPS